MRNWKDLEDRVNKVRKKVERNALELYKPVYKPEKKKTSDSGLRENWYIRSLAVVGMIAVPLIVVGYFCNQTLKWIDNKIPSNPVPAETQVYQPSSEFTDIVPTTELTDIVTKESVTQDATSIITFSLTPSPSDIPGESTIISEPTNTPYVQPSRTPMPSNKPYVSPSNTPYIPPTATNIPPPTNTPFVFPTDPPTTVPTNTVAPVFDVYDVWLDIDEASYTGPCPHIYEFMANFTWSGTGYVTVRSDYNKPGNPWDKYVSSSSGIGTASTHMSFNHNTSGPFTFTYNILSPRIMSASHTFQTTCQ